MNIPTSKLKSYLLYIFIVGIPMVVVSCKDAQKQEANTSVNNLNGNYAVEVSMENQVFHIQPESLLPVKTKFTKDSILLLFREEENPFQLNLNLTHTDILVAQNAKYSIPDENAGKIKVDLNFFNSDRNTKSINKRIIFRKGIIKIDKLTENELDMTFKGEGSGITERDNNFLISGKIKATFTQ